MAVSVDRPEDSLRVVERNRLPFSILSDREGVAIRAYGVLHPGGGPRGQDIALPAHFLIDRGTIAWRFVASNVNERVDPDEVRRQVAALP